jgi:hypothetical protein
LDRFIDGEACTLEPVNKARSPGRPGLHSYQEKTRGNHAETEAYTTE